MAKSPDKRPGRIDVLELARSNQSPNMAFAGLHPLALDLLNGGIIESLEVWPMKFDEKPDGSTCSERCVREEANFWSITGIRKDNKESELLGDSSAERIAMIFAQSLCESFSIPINHGGIAIFGGLKKKSRSRSAAFDE